MLPLISFQAGRRTQTQSSGQLSGLDSQWKSGSIWDRNQGREANARGEKSKEFTPRPSEAR